ncbi:hypothetical protein DH2020_047263 [Rehmannia glutinosa]|uniref:Reverse transcriptase zinc-binding domain-containing protein n=1 Tax=Rehmannia glutinosa TaxID=99300 RepID=A0ABR0U9J8_REHGL
MAFNLALLSKQAWRLITNPSSLLARVYKAKYHRNCSLLDAKMHHRPSWSWRSIMDSRKILLEGCIKRIHSGSNTRVWGDRWIPKAPYFLPRPNPCCYPQTMRVSDLIDVETNSWKTDLIRHVFPEQEANLILSIPLHCSNHNDTWYWVHSKNGKFSVKSAYYTMLHAPNLSEVNRMGNSSTGISTVWRKLWKLTIPARISHFAWRALTDSLPTPSNLSASSPFATRSAHYASPMTPQTHTFSSFAPSLIKYGLTAEKLALREALGLALSEGHMDISIIGDSLCSNRFFARDLNNPEPTWNLFCLRSKLSAAT